MISWLFDTLIATGFLMAIILLLRRPVARAFGPGVAYALWALPLIRLILPPLILPASFAPKAGLLENIHPVLASAAPAVAENTTRTAGWGLADWSVAIWLCGAVALLIWRAWSYAAMRRQLLEGARPMGEADGIRIVETPAVSAPVAFGVFDKVVALPWGFMASPDRRSRNFALEHEFQHHTARDLAANFAFQPLLALHWFNPIGWLAWRAMRRDQEAACDARVLAGRGSAARQAYGRLIAGYAAGPRLALVTPMACPVLGEKSIVERLKCLTRPEVSGRRRAAGGALLAASALALPLTATISYADSAPPVGQAGSDAPLASVDENAARHAPLTPADQSGGETVVPPSAQPVTDQDGDVGAEPPVARTVGANSWTGHTEHWPPAPPVPPPLPAPPRVAVNVFGPDYGDAAGEDCSEYAERMVDRSISKRAAQSARARFSECTRRVAKAQVAESLSEARMDIAEDDSMPESVRRDVLANFDRHIARLSRHR